MKLTESKLRSIIQEELQRLDEAVMPGFFNAVSAALTRHPDVNVKEAEYASPGPVSSSPTINFELLDKRGGFTATFKDRTPDALISVTGPMLREKFQVEQSEGAADEIANRIVEIGMKA